MLTAADLHEVVIAFIHQAAPEAAVGNLGPDGDVLTLIDSYTFLELIQHLEEKVGFQIDLSEADPTAFTHIGRLIEIVVGQQGGAA